MKTDLDGKTTVPNLYAIGECAHTGLHGANRLASNSLLEGMVLSQNAAASVRTIERHRPAQIATWSKGTATDSNDAIVVSLNWEEIRRFMWSYLGIVRSDKRIERARHRIEVLRDEIREYYIDFKITSDLIGAAQPRTRRSSDHRERAAPQGVTRPALHARLSREAASRAALRAAAHERTARLTSV